jgi:hypothetical protein
MKKEMEDRLEKVRALEQEKALMAQKKSMVDDETMTVIDAENEQILRQREFN